MMRFGLISDDRRRFGFTSDDSAVSDTASNVDALDFIFLYATFGGSTRPPPGGFPPRGY